MATKDDPCITSRAGNRCVALFSVVSNTTGLANPAAKAAKEAISGLPDDLTPPPILDPLAFLRASLVVAAIPGELTARAEARAHVRSVFRLLDGGADVDPAAAGLLNDMFAAQVDDAQAWVNEVARARAGARAIAASGGEALPKKEPPLAVVEDYSLYFEEVYGRGGARLPPGGGERTGVAPARLPPPPAPHVKKEEKVKGKGGKRARESD